MTLFQVEIDFDASEAVEAAETLSRAGRALDALPSRLREDVERFASSHPAPGEDQDRPGLTASVDRGVAVVRCNPTLRALVGSLRAQGVG